MILEFLKDQARLSSPLTLAIVLAAGALWLWCRRTSVAPRVYGLVVAALYWLVTTPLGANLLVRPLAAAFHRVDSRDAAGGADAVILLGGGIATATVAGQTAAVPTSSTLFRSLEAARVYKVIGARLMVVSGGNARPDRQAEPESTLLRRLVVEAGVPAEKVVDESRSTTTHDQAVFVDALLRPRGVRRIVVVTSPAHMRRSLALFRKAGFDPVGSMAPTRSDQMPPPPLLLPNQESLTLSDDATYEYCALIYYWARGWL